MTLPLVMLAIGAALGRGLFSSGRTVSAQFPGGHALAGLSGRLAGRAWPTRRRSTGASQREHGLTLAGIAAAAVIYLGPARQAARLARGL